jgi:hypothetical protein
MKQYTLSDSEAHQDFPLMDFPIPRPDAENRLEETGQKRME